MSQFLKKEIYMNHRRIYLNVDGVQTGPFLWRSVAHMVASGKLGASALGCMEKDIQEKKFVPVQTLIERCYGESGEEEPAAVSSAVLRLKALRRETSYGLFRYAVDWTAAVCGLLVAWFAVSMGVASWRAFSAEALAYGLLALTAYVLGLVIGWQLLRMAADFMDIQLRRHADRETGEK